MSMRRVESGSVLFGLVVSAVLGGCAAADAEGEGTRPSESGGSELTAADVTFLQTELLGRPTANSVTVNAMIQGAIVVYFEYGTSPGQYSNSTPAVTYSDGMVEAVISGLSADTRYYYRMRYRPTGTQEPYLAGTERTFHTQRAASATFQFAVQSDSHQGFESFYSDALYGVTMQNIAADMPDLLFDLGDTFSLDGNETVASVREKYLDQRDFFGLVGHSTPLFLVLGNHENEEGWNLDDKGSNVAMSLPVMSANARKRYFVNPVPNGFYTGNSETLQQLDGDKLRENYYAFEWGNVLFVALDPFWYTMTKPYTGTLGGEQNDEVVGNRWSWTLGDKQYQWLTQTLQSSTKPFKVVMAHHTTGGVSDYGRGGAKAAKFGEWGGYNVDGTTWGFSTKRPGWSKTIHQLFVDTGVSIFFHGHDHVYAREVLDGIVYQEVPHAANSNYGYGFSTNQTDYAGSVMHPNSGYLRVTAEPEAMTVEYVRSFANPAHGQNGSIAHSYTIEQSTCPDADGDGTSDCSDGCPNDPNKAAPAVCGCGVPDLDANGNGTMDCQEPSGCSGQCTCSGATLRSDDADGVARVGATITWTAGATCSGGSPQYQFRTRYGNGAWQVARAYGSSPVFAWNTAGRPAGSYRVQVLVREATASASYQSFTGLPFRLTN